MSSTIGAVLEWFDFFAFASLSGLILGKLFFSPTDPAAEILLGFSTLAVGYFARPIGGIIFGHFGDRLGRKPMLMITIWLMGVSTVLLGLFPTYSVIGIGATVTLVLLRVIQGLAVGGEYGGAALLIIEHAAKSNRRGLYSAWANVGASMGFLLASALLALLTATTTQEQFETWGWRVPFLVSAVLLLVGSYIRKQIQDTPEFKKLKSQEEGSHSKVHKVPLLTLLKTQWRALITAVAVPLATLVFYQIGLVFITPYATRYAGYGATAVLTAITIAQLFYIALSISFAYLSDRIGRRPVMAFGAVGCALWVSFVYFNLLKDGNFPQLVLAVTGLLFFVAATWGPQAAFLAELFSADVRYSGISVGYQLAGALSGLTPLVAFAALSGSGSWFAIALGTAAVSVVAGIGIATTKETAFERLRN
ncbi:MFS transporter [Arthrobacter globiformis]|uniref:MFS transporter n=1 Tax=Arthrobacter globiformis TaxID=1665 RepID=UPI003979EFC2